MFIVLEAYDRIVGLALRDIPVDGRHTKAPCGGACSGRSPVDRTKGGKTAAEHGLPAEVAVKGIAAPIQNTKRWPVERTNAWGNQFVKITRCNERREKVIDAYLALAHAVITLRRLIRQAWTFYRWDTRPKLRP